MVSKDVCLRQVAQSLRMSLNLPKYSSFFFFNIYLFLRDRERQSMSRGGTERERETEFKEVSRLQAVSTEPYAGLELMDLEIMTWAKVRCLIDWATQMPLICIFMIIYDVKHLFRCLFVSYLSFLVRCLLRSLAHLKKFSYYCFRSSLYILNKNPLSDVSFVNIFSFYYF